MIEIVNPVGAEVKKEIAERWKSSVSSEIQPSSPTDYDVGVK